MKIVKPQRLGLLTRVFENDGQSYLVLTAMGFFSFGAPRRLLHEVALWKTAAEQMGRDGALDAGMTKQRGEVLVRGSAFAKDGVPTPATSVLLRVGSVEKELYVVGDRVWEGSAPSAPAPFVEMPITWERAFGGEGFPENPAGRGARPVEEGGRKTHPLPNIESPACLIKSPADRPPPAALGPIDQTWPQRMRLAGTYDAAWLRTRYPGYPADLDWEYFNVAPEDQRIQGYFRPDEAFRIEGMHPQKRVLESRLPGVTARLFATLRGTGDGVLREAAARLDTVILFPNVERGVVIFRGALPIEEDDGADVIEVVAAFEDPAAPRSPEHYLSVRDRRRDRKNGALYTLVDDDLMPPWKEPDEAPEERWHDMDDIAGAGGHRAAYAQRKIDRRLAEAREEWVARGLDPAEFDEKTRPREKPPTDLSRLPAYLEEVEKERDLLVAQAKTRREEAMASARERCQKAGIDFDAVMERRKTQAGGPPRFSARQEMERLRGRARFFREAGKPSPALEASLKDPRFEARLRDLEDRAREAYRRGAHLFPPAAPLDAATSARLRLSAEIAKSEGESLAGRDFTGADLSGLDLAGVDLGSALLERANLAGATLSRATLSNATLARADLRGARLAKADLSGANLGQADLRDADLEGANLTDAILYEADLRGARLGGAELRRAMLHGAKLEGVDLRGAEARELVLLEANLKGANLQSVNLEKAVLLRCDLAGVDLSRASLSRASFVECALDGAIFASAVLEATTFTLGCSLAGCDFKGARLTRTLLRGARLAKADLSGVDAPDCDFSEADLRDAKLARLSSPRSLFVRTNLRGADLGGADLMLAILQKAQLHGADLRGANLFRADMAKVRGDKDTRLDGALTAQVRTVPEKNQRGVLS